MKKTVSFMVLFCITMATLAQHQELTEKGVMWKGKTKHVADTTSFYTAFHRGAFNGHFRSFTMFTDNQSGLSDYHAQALGAGIKFESGSFHRFKLGISAFAVFNAFSSDLGRPDASSNATNRYEIGLFDIENPSNKTDIDRFEELYLKYDGNITTVTIGRQLVNSVFINLQDGRMRPTEIQGIRAEFNPTERVYIDAGIFNAISPRSTVRWYNIGESIGIYPQGVNDEGRPSNYANNINSEFIALVDVKIKWTPWLETRTLNQYVDRLFNSAFQEATWHIVRQEQQKLSFSSMLIRQDAEVDHSVHHHHANPYIKHGHGSWAFGAQLKYTLNKNQWSIAYNRITDHGQYLMPREWGRDPFYTFVPRERIEGYANVHSVLAKYQYKWPKQHLRITTMLGHNTLPEANDASRNKYGMPSFAIGAIDLRYEFQGKLKGLDAQALVVHKAATGDTFNNTRFVINKVNMTTTNLVFNYHF